MQLKAASAIQTESSDIAEQYQILDYLTAIMLIQIQPRTAEMRVVCPMTWLEEALKWEALHFFLSGTF